MELIYLALFLLGLCFGSFAGAMVWRLRAKQLTEDKGFGEKVDRKEYSKLHSLNKSSALNDYSRCLDCGYRLRWYDLIPLVSWLVLRGRCRKCRKPIGYMEPLIELGLAVVFVFSYILWPYQLITVADVVRLVIWLSACVALAILFVYDTKWLLLPDIANYTVVIFGVINSIMLISLSSDRLGQLISVISSIATLSGLYFVIYLVSKGKWVGFGDVKLGLGLGLVLADWRLALLALFTANLVGCVIVIPAMLAHTLKRDSHIPFGPLLIAGFLIAGLFGEPIINLFLFSL